jgi:hypothetical protein
VSQVAPGDPASTFQCLSMETLRLRKIQQPSYVERLLEALVTRGSLVPKECYRIRDYRALSHEMQRVVRESQRGHTWACWANDPHAWLFTCVMSFAASRERGTPVLMVNLYDDAGELKDSGPWVPDRDGSWRRCVE